MAQAADEDAKQGTQEGFGSIELQAPAGWKKLYTPRKSGTPRRTEITFISPVGEVIKSKTKLTQYFKSHPGGPSVAEFDWGTGDTPRRSSRLSEKLKAVVSSAKEPPSKTRKMAVEKKASEATEHAEENEPAPQKAEHEEEVPAQSKETEKQLQESGKTTESALPTEEPAEQQQPPPEPKLQAEEYQEVQQQPPPELKLQAEEYQEVQQQQQQAEHKLETPESSVKVEGPLKLQEAATSTRMDNDFQQDFEGLKDERQNHIGIQHPVPLSIG